MTQVWRKISQHLLMGLGTLSLLVVMTGMSAEMPRSSLWKLKIPKIEAQPICSEKSFLESLTKSKVDQFCKSEDKNIQPKGGLK
jgi:hypothetical protein